MRATQRPPHPSALKKELLKHGRLSHQLATFSAAQCAKFEKWNDEHHAFIRDWLRALQSFGPN